MLWRGGRLAHDAMTSARAHAEHVRVGRRRTRRRGRYGRGRSRVRRRRPSRRRRRCCVGRYRRRVVATIYGLELLAQLALELLLLMTRLRLIVEQSRRSTRRSRRRRHLEIVVVHTRRLDRLAAATYAVLLVGRGRLRRVDNRRVHEAILGFY